MRTVYYNNELYHHGVLGQKWGVRRYQNTDGTLTTKGKVHKRQMTDRKMVISAKGSKENQKKQSGREDLSKLSDQEVQAKLNRVRNELQYYQTQDQLNAYRNNGKNATKKALTALATAGVVGNNMDNAMKLSKYVPAVTGALAVVGGIALRSAAINRNSVAKRALGM